MLALLPKATTRVVVAGAVTALCTVFVQACGSRTGLFDEGTDPLGQLGADASIDGPKDPPIPDSCETEGEEIPCGSSLGICRPGRARCRNGVFGPCEGGVVPRAEDCNGLDDDCDGVVDNGFNVGQSCDGPDTDKCTDDVMTCNGCSVGKDDIETCNGRDDDCDGITDSDCEIGSCNPALLVTGSTPSSPNCIDFPVVKGSRGAIQYPCTGGPVSANIGDISFSGTAANNEVHLTGTSQGLGPDGCTWEFSHAIDGNLPSGKLTYSYSERIVDQNGQRRCWSPCTELGTVQVDW